MTEALLSTKFYMPALRQTLVPRRRLVERMNAGLGQGSKLTLVSAPAGFGKSTLVSEWAASLNAEGVKAGWLSLDENDKEIGRFLKYMIEALRRVEGLGGEIGGSALSMLESPQVPPMMDVLTAWINELAGIGEQIVLVLDDYHLVEAPQVDEAVAFLLENGPPGLSLVMVTRSDPLLPLARLRVRGELGEVRAAELRFTRGEAAEFLNRVMGLGLGEGEIAALEERTEGWIAGLQLAAISMRGHKDTEGFIKTFTGSHRFVLDYLIEEVLEQQGEEVQRFLLKTSILERLSGPLCDAVTGEGGGQGMLEALERGNLFIVALDEARGWYRYHHLFGELLRQRMERRGTEQVEELHLRASTWYESVGDVDRATEHALKGGAYERAAGLIENYLDDIWQLGEHSRLQRWLDEIPLEVSCSRPHVCLLYAANLYTRGRIEEAEQRLQTAEQALGVEPLSGTDGGRSAPVRQPDPDRVKLWGRAAAVRSYLVAHHGDLGAAIIYARQALEYLPESDANWRWSAYDSIGTAYSGNDEAAAYQARLEALTASKTAGNDYMILYASMRLVVSLRDLGRLQQALEICQQQYERVKGTGLAQTALTGWLFTLWGEILAEINQLDQALEWVNKGMALTRRGKDAVLFGSSYLCLLRVLFSRGEMDTAGQTIREMNAFVLSGDLSDWITNQIAAWQARIWLAHGQPDRAADWALQCGLDVEEELTPQRDFDYAVFARLLIAQERLEEAGRLLQRLLEAAEAGGRLSKMIELGVLQALAFEAAADTSQALTVLERAFALAEPDGFIRIFVDEGPPMGQLLYKALEGGLALDYVRRLLGAFPAVEMQTADTGRSQTAQQDLIEPLSEREIEVLELLAKGLTNPEIGSRLYLSLNTVKVHTRNIYGKLGVNNRTQAVARAQALGILPSPT